MVIYIGHVDICLKMEPIKQFYIAVYVGMYDELSTSWMAKELYLSISLLNLTYLTLSFG